MLQKLEARTGSARPGIPAFRGNLPCRLGADALGEGNRTHECAISGKAGSQRTSYPCFNIQRATSSWRANQTREKPFM